MKRTKLKARGTSDTSVLKEEIQKHLRLCAIKRDEHCVLQNKGAGACDNVLQAEHLNSRSNMLSFADMRNIVLLCRRHHIYWKPQNSQRYWELIEQIIGEERWEYYKRVRDDKKPYKIDLKMELLALKQELSTG